MDKIAGGGASPLPIEQAGASPASRETDILPAKVYAVIALTSMLTFGTLVTGYQLLFSHHLFA